MNRKPPTEVRQALRAEVGFCCPVPGCASPYLEWHHFDPPWRTREHHEPGGMVALCRTHHIAADNGAFTNDQLHEFKRKGATDADIKGRFEWRRHQLLGIVGGSFFYQTMRLIVIGGNDVVSFNRDPDGYLQVSINMLSLSTQERLVMKDNCWENIGNPVDFVCPPSGKHLSVIYENGDSLEITFDVAESADEFERKHGRRLDIDVEFPLTTVEVNGRIANAGIEFTKKHSLIGTNRIMGSTIIGARRSGFNIGSSLEYRQNWCLIPNPGSRLAKCPCGSGKRYKHCHGTFCNA